MASTNMFILLFFLTSLALCISLRGHILSSNVKPSRSVNSLGLGNSDDSTDVYYPVAGLESQMYNRGNLRPMIGSEYDIAFSLYPGLLQQARTNR